VNVFTKKPLWYAAGLAFECLECGNCCAGPDEGFVWATEDEVAAIARYLGLSTDETRRRYVRNVGSRLSLRERPVGKDCVFLAPAARGTRKCRIYPVRPTQCRTWPFWKANLASPNSWALAGLRCGGINRGRTYSLEEIEQRRDVTRT